MENLEDHFSGRASETMGTRGSKMVPVNNSTVLRVSRRGQEEPPFPHGSGAQSGVQKESFPRPDHQLPCFARKVPSIRSKESSGNPQRRPQDGPMEEVSRSSVCNLSGPHCSSTRAKVDITRCGNQSGGSAPAFDVASFKYAGLSSDRSAKSAPHSWWVKWKSDHKALKG